MTQVMIGARFSALNPEDFEIDRDGVILHVMRYWNGNACVVERGANGEGPDKGAYPLYDKKPAAEAEALMLADGWALRTTKQMSVTSRSHGYNNTSIQGVCSPDVTVEDVKKRFYHDYFGGRGAWVSGGKFGCTIHID